MDEPRLHLEGEKWPADVAERRLLELERLTRQHRQDLEILKGKLNEEEDELERLYQRFPRRRP